jgi:thiosulfate/3-mercaptopyruvate sulfurtransferase
MGYNIDGLTYVVAEDLRAFGMDVVWNSGDRTLSITRGASTISPPPVPANLEPVGSAAFPFFYTDIVTYINGNRVDSYNIQGQTVVSIDDLVNVFGQSQWLGEERMFLAALAIPRPESMFITPTELHSLIQQGYPNLVVLGVATGANTIPGSFTLPEVYDATMVGGPYSEGSNVRHSRKPLEEMEDMLSRAGITADSLVVVYTNSANQGARMVWELTVLGLDVLYLDGGIPAWVAAGLPIGEATDILTAPPISDFKVVNYRQDEMNIGLAGVFHAVQNPDEWVIIDSRSAPEYEGLELRHGRLFSGRIAGAIHIEWTNAVVPDTGSHQIRPEAELREIFAPALDGRRVILYCHGGPRAAHSWLLLTNLGVEAYLFNGSWDAWAYALDPANNSPYRELAVQFTEAQPAAQQPAAQRPSLITTVLSVPAVHCPRCVLPVIAVLETLEGIVGFDTDFDERSISIVHYPHLTEATIRNALIAAGITVS